ncbi:la protein 1-like [Zea mays]|uniref:la protein 1-like n=1 Tax=Zea mays TaxID=4577 RepID=UPI000C6C43E8|nr:la protein 1-like [Zea mays]|eukprot:XP_023157542.1 la protein 1-like [Zea mays]
MATTSSRGEASSSSPPRKTLMRSHLGLEGDAKPETVPEETVLVVVDILRRSTALRVLEDGKKVGRSKELLKPDEVIEQVDSRTVAASPLPYNVKLEEVESFFAQCSKVALESARIQTAINDVILYLFDKFFEMQRGDIIRALNS